MSGKELRKATEYSVCRRALLSPDWIRAKRIINEELERLPDSKTALEDSSVCGGGLGGGERKPFSEILCSDNI